MSNYIPHPSSFPRPIFFSDIRNKKDLTEFCQVSSLAKGARWCRVLLSFEPAFAGGPRSRNATLAKAYRIVPVKLEP